MSIAVAFQAFFAALFKREAAERIRLALSGKEATPKLTSDPSRSSESKPTAPAAPKPSEPARSEALTLLATLQREARLLDLIHESLDGFSDAQIGAAAKEVLRDSRKTLERMFGVASLADAEEGASLAIEPTASPNRIRLVGKSAGSSGVVVHRGWKATRCEVPKWSGKRDEAWLLAPVEVEVN
jgi:hypothetical protein